MRRQALNACRHLRHKWIFWGTSWRSALNNSPSQLKLGYDRADLCDSVAVQCSFCDSRGVKKLHTYKHVLVFQQWSNRAAANATGITKLWDCRKSRLWLIWTTKRLWETHPQRQQEIPTKLPLKRSPLPPLDQNRILVSEMSFTRAPAKIAVLYHKRLPCFTRSLSTQTAPHLCQIGDLS